jgi:ABC-type multidrug transport system ATPase subunit
MDGAFVEFRHVHASYKEPAGLGALFGKASSPTLVLKDISFALESGSQVAVFGFAASGKSTLLKILSGAMLPDSGTVILNGKKPEVNSSTAAGYVSLEHEEPKHETAYELLHGFGTAHGIDNLPASIAEVAQEIGIQNILHRNAYRLSTSERVKVRLARAALSDAPILLFDDIADVLGAQEMKNLLNGIFQGRSVCITTRSVEVAEALNIPILLLHKFSLVHMGTRNDIAHATGVARVVDAWVEGMRYDLLRKLRAHPGVLEVRLMPTDQFEGTRVRVVIRNSRYLPALYDALSQAPLVNIQELPVPLSDILDSLP